MITIAWMEHHKCGLNNRDTSDQCRGLTVLYITSLVNIPIGNRNDFTLYNANELNIGIKIKITTMVNVTQTGDILFHWK